MTTNKPVLVSRCKYCPFGHFSNYVEEGRCTYNDYIRYDAAEAVYEAPPIPHDAVMPSWCPLRSDDVYVQYYVEEEI